MGTSSSVTSGRRLPWLASTTGRPLSVTSDHHSGAAHSRGGSGRSAPTQWICSGTCLRGYSNAGVQPCRCRYGEVDSSSTVRLRRAEAEVGTHRVVAALGVAEHDPARDHADEPVAQPPDRTAHGQQRRPERRGVGLEVRQRSVAEGGPRRPTELVAEPDAVHQAVAEHRVDLVRGEDRAEVGDALRSMPDEDVRERATDGVHPAQPDELREGLLG